ncbi:MAG: nuclease NucT [Nitratiruptor sp.]|nr:nuclease NucT [Nitratiruptor sp.]NPA83051.1 DUF1669 domain-containing protein [Campylobacterota bacterium]
MRRLFLLSILSLTLFSGELYFTPFESQEALKKLLRWIDQAHSSIDVAIYTFTNHTIAKRLKNAAKRGVRIRIIVDEKQAFNRYSQVGYLAKYRNIALFTLQGKRLRSDEEYMGKMHLKLAIIDGKRLIFGSANWSYSAFKRNYELLYFIQDYSLAKKARKYFHRLLSRAKPY